MTPGAVTEIFEAVAPAVEALQPAHTVDQIRAAVREGNATFRLESPFLMLLVEGAEVFRMPVDAGTVQRWNVTFGSTSRWASHTTYTWWAGMPLLPDGRRPCSPSS